MSNKYFYDCLNTHNCGYGFTSDKEEKRCKLCDSSFIDLWKVENNKVSKIFDSIEEIEKAYGVEVEIPKTLPNGCNVICYKVDGLYTVNFFQACKENEQGFFSLEHGGVWEKASNSLEDQIEWDKANLCKDRIYLRLVTKDNSDVFNHNRLIGVETTRGIITNVVEYRYGNTKPTYFAYTSESLSKEDLFDLDTLEIFISDSTDDVVSLKEYIEMFYEG